MKKTLSSTAYNPKFMSSLTKINIKTIAYKFLFILIITSCTHKEETLSSIEIKPKQLYYLVWQDVVINKPDDVNIVFDKDFKINKLNNTLYEIFTGNHKGVISFYRNSILINSDTIRTKPVPKLNKPDFLFKSNKSEDSLIIEMDLYSLKFDSMFHGQYYPKFYNFNATVFYKNIEKKFYSDTIVGKLIIPIDNFDSVSFSANQYEHRSNLKNDKGIEYGLITTLKEEYKATYPKIAFEKWMKFGNAKK